MSVSQQDLIAGLDPTGRTSISGAQLAQLISGATPFTDKGVVLVSADVASVPVVPDASTTTKWQNYIWIRQAATQAIPYVWNPAAASDPTYLKWQTVSAASIGVGTIINSMIADNTIQDGKIVSLSYSKLIGAPANLPPSGAAGGDLTGTYPNPSVANGAITGAKMAAATITHTNIAAAAVQPVTDVLPNGVGLTLLRTNAGASAVEWATPAQAGARILQIVQTTSTAITNSSGNLASATAIPNANTTGVTDSTLLQAITPLSAASTLLVEVTFPVGCVSAAGSVFVGLFTANSGAVAAVAGSGYTTPSSVVSLSNVTFKYSVASASLALRTYYVLFGVTAGASAYMNSKDGSNNLFGITTASIKITEYL